ncbi:unnamed protein product [Brachionus calyciflorus]|uniref:Uncharacterized protein n=1 Tax=Brachionus calyciflorus TaxID=104777 RepID=A0A813NDJ1_9BILA|nr:unnamed protein product [Brachionus calyciflorus]
MSPNGDGSTVMYKENDLFDKWIKTKCEIISYEKITEKVYDLIEKWYEVIALTRSTGRGQGRDRGRGSRGVGRGRNLELIPGNFSKDWNHANKNGPGTNNLVEGFHHKLNNWITKAHPDIYELISPIKLIESGLYVDYKSRMIGYSGPKRRALDVQKDIVYENIMVNLNYKVIDLKQYIRSCSYLVNFNNIMMLV